MGSSDEYTVEYKFTADVKGLEQGVDEVKHLVNEATESAEGMGKGMSEGAQEAATSVEDLNLKMVALAAAIATIETTMAVSSLNTFKDYENAVYGMATAVSNVGGTIEQAMGAIRESTASGLLSETDAAEAIRNLTQYGYSVREATELIKAMTNVSIANLKTGETVDEKVIRMTEAVKNHSDVMLRRNGVIDAGTQANENYARSIGKTVDELNDEEKSQARTNAILQAGQESSQIATMYQESYAAATQRLANKMEDLKIVFGQILAPVATWLANAATWIVENRELVAGMLTFVGALIGGYSVYKGLMVVVNAVKAAVAWFSALSAAGKGVVGVLTAIVTVATVAATVAAVNSMKTGLEGLTGASKDATESNEALAGSIGGVGGAARNTTKDLEKLRRQYLDELKQIEVRHKESIDKLTKQIQEANVDYRRAIDERNAAFEVSQAKEEKKHQEKVDEITTQIAFLQRYNNTYNRQKLANLEFALAKENALYQKQTKAAKEELELQNENDRIAYETKRRELQAELDDEVAFMEKHRETLKQVQNYILEDEIEALNRRYKEQEASYAEQASLAGGAGADIASALADGVTGWFDDNSWVFEQSGKFLGIDWSNGILNGIEEGLKKIRDWLPGIVIYTDEQGHKITLGNISSVWNGIGKYADWLIPSRAVQRLTNGIMNAFKGQSSASGEGWATGGYTGQGGVNEVAGIVHKGEYVLPQEMVDQNTGTPKALGNTYVTVNLSGTFATSAAERRKVADQIVQAINQNNKSRLEAQWQ